MCPNCFTKEINRFENLPQWQAFDLELSNRLAQGKLTQIRVVNTGQRDGEEISYVYECVTCRQKWKLEEPHDHGDGYFVNLSTFENLFLREQNGRRLAMMMVIILIVFVLLRVIFW